MGKIDLEASSFWESADCHVMVNSRDTRAQSEAQIITRWVAREPELSGHLLFSTSGSTGEGKWVALPRRALLVSAQAVNQHLRVTADDCWLAALPDFHVGGVGVYARAYLASCRVVRLEGRWCAEEFHKLAIKEKVTLSALVPTQLVDLVNAGLQAPELFRAVVIGGGFLSADVYERAEALGWCIIETYGMTETCSQVATASVGERELRVLPIWQTKLNDRGALMLRGEAMMTGYVTCGDSACKLEKHDEWLTTSDLVHLEKNTLTMLGRVDRCVKVLGELVNLAEVEQDLLSYSSSQVDFVVIAVPDLRQGSRLVVCCIKEDASVVESVLQSYQQQCVPFKRVTQINTVREIPRTALNKVRYAELTESVLKAAD